MAKKFKYGWLHADRKTMLYVWEVKNSWGVTRRFYQAKQFSSKEACINHYLSKLENKQSGTSHLYFFSRGKQTTLNL